MEFERISAEQAGIPSERILAFLEGLKKSGIEIHSMMLLRHSKVFAESWWKPYNKDSRHIMFSFTKSLTSTAIGFAVQEGTVSLDDKLTELLPEYVPENPCENLKKCTIRHLLTMSCGHETEIEKLGMGDPNWIKAFFAHPFKYEPGTHFMYNTAGTNLLSVILTKKTGLVLMDYLKPRLFEKLGMHDIPCYSFPDGIQIGGAGSRLSTDEMARFIQFIANRGIWNGERLLNDSWFDLATTKQIDTSAFTKDPDWSQGYGFQFWRCVPEGLFRADGAFGQFGIVCSAKDLVMIFTSASSNAPQLLSTVWEELLPYFKDEELPENHDAQVILNYVLSHNELTPVYGTRSLTAAANHSGKIYVPVSPKKIHGGWADFIGGAGVSCKGIYSGIIKPTTDDDMSEIRIEFEPNTVKLIAKLGGSEEALPISLESHFNSFTLAGKTYGACGAWRSNSVFEFTVRCAEAATGKRYFMTFSENGFKLDSFSTMPDMGGLNDEKSDAAIFAVKKQE